VKDQVDDANRCMNSLKSIGIDDDLDKVGRLRGASKTHNRAQSALIRPPHMRSNALFKANYFRDNQGATNLSIADNDTAGAMARQESQKMASSIGKTR